MEKLGWNLGRNLTIDYRWGIFDFDKARLAAVELLRLAPDVILCGGTPATLAFRQATNTVPIVFASVSEPVAQGLVRSLAHPGGNLTGFSYMEPTMGAKWLDLLTLKSSIFAVLRFTASENLVGCCTGRSAGLPPRNM